MSQQEQDKLAADAEEVQPLLADLSSDFENENDDLDISMSTLSGLVLCITEDKQLQTDPVKYEQPPIRSLRKCHPVLIFLVYVLTDIAISSETVLSSTNRILGSSKELGFTPFVSMLSDMQFYVCHSRVRLVSLSSFLLPLTAMW